jgi:hypothetical protein
VAKLRLARHLRKRTGSLGIRIRALGALRKLVRLSTHQDITARQWSVLETQLSVVVARLLSRLKREADQHSRSLQEQAAAVRFNAILGELELDLSKAYTFFDTYVDILTQRTTPALGPLLAGCDMLAWDALKKDHPALDMVEPPLVYCDRGFGASILREGVPLPDFSPNPMPLIQIPYSRLKEKYNLTSIHHEAGHQALRRTGLQTAIPLAFRAALARGGASRAIRRFFSLWSSEIGPDFWAFCSAGVAQPSATREILALPPAHAFRVAASDPHPPPYLRVLLSLEWTRQVWGQGEWNNWEYEWRKCYPLQLAPPAMRQVLQDATAYLPVVASTLLNTKFRVLEGRTIPDLFDLQALAPWKLRTVAATAQRGCLNLTGLSPSVQLAVFRFIRERSGLSEEALNRLMSVWLRKLGRQRMMWN